VTVSSENAFVLTRQWRDTAEGIELVFWATGAHGAVRIQLDRQEAVGFVERGRVDVEKLGGRSRPLELTTLSGKPVDGLYFPSWRALVDARPMLRSGGAQLHELDVKPADRFLMERFVTGGLTVTGELIEHPTFREYRNPRIEACDYRPALRTMTIDIETDSESTLYSIAATTRERAHVFLLRSPDWDSTVHGDRIDELAEHSIHPDETTLLEEFFAWVASLDPDVLIGWNVIDFDLRFIETRCQQLNLAFALGRGRDRATLLASSGPSGKRVARIPGRAVLDGIDTLRTATWSFDDFGLNAVAGKLLGRGKLIDSGDEDNDEKIDEIRRLYREAPWDLARYNLEDCRLVEEIFEHAQLIDFAIERAQLTGLALDRVGGSVAAFDNLYLPRLHRKGRVAPNVDEHDLDVSDSSPGGFVMDSVPGLFGNVIVLDFKSLYPSIIRTFLVDPLGLAVDSGDQVAGFEGASFSKQTHILPELIEHLWRARDRAKLARNDALSRAIKIIMNSFYGVLGTTACRFFDPRLASSITLRGHEIITRSRTFIEEAGHRVIYGDTDSLFVVLEADASGQECSEIGSEIARGLTAFWSEEVRRAYGLTSYLELELDKHYLRFFMPTVRDSEQGSKKRYAGLVRRAAGVELQFTGLEAVRSDWTPLAREFQRELYRRIFHDQPFEDFVKETAEAVLAGRRDTELFYRKRLRRRLKDYVKNVPPHAQAARKSKRVGRWIRYVVTVNGPEPVDNNPSPIDYQHYVDRQLAPAGDALLHVKGTSVGKILDRQMSLF
jgi:DNA polymerase-2